jgi:CRP-like cAMP-binding protein/uncharacterized protein (DUF2249 family)
MDSTHVDVRGLPTWERPGIIREALDRLPDGVAITLITENEPRGLASRIVQRQRGELICEPRRIGRQEWHITLRRIPVDGDRLSAVGVLRRAGVFAGLDERAREVLASSAAIFTLRRGQAVVESDTEWPYIGVVCEGVFALASNGDDRRDRIFFEVFPYEVFGEMEAFDEALMFGRVVALSKSARYIRLPRADVLQAAQEFPSVLASLARVTTQRARHVMEALVAQPTMPIVVRIARALLPYSMPERGLSPAAFPLPGMTQAQIAASAGTVKEVAARAISDLEEAGLLQRERGHIRYLDRQRLLELVRTGALA